MARDTIRKMIIVRYKACPVCHGSFFGWKERLLKYGGLDPKFSVTPDWEYYFRILKAGERIGHIPKVHYKYTTHADMGALKYSTKVEEQRRLLHETYHVNGFHILLRGTVGRLASYLSNPYRTPLIKGIRREFGGWIASRK
jgi:hypothetical protein